MKISAKAIYKLTLLWAFAESGLGGMLHAFRLPVTGLVLGAFAVLIISLIAHFSQHVWADIMKATLLVLAVKLTISPHSPLTAYVAVFFQGLAGACVFSFIGRSRSSVLFFSVIVLVESALQRPLLATLVFGTEVWLAIDSLINQLLGFFSLSINQSFSLLFISAYTLLHLLWGAVVGFWAYTVPEKLNSLAVDVEKLPKAINVQQTKVEKSKVILWFIVLLVILALILYLVQASNPFYYIIRTSLLLVVVYFVLGPLLRLMLKRSAAHQQNFLSDFSQALPALQLSVARAYHLATTESHLFTRYKRFVLYLLFLNLIVDEANA